MSATRPAPSGLVLAAGEPNSEITVGRKKVRLRNFDKLFGPELQVAQRNWMQHDRNRAPYCSAPEGSRHGDEALPGGRGGRILLHEARAHSARPLWTRTCAIEHGSGSITDFPIVQDLAPLLWIVKLGCIHLNPWRPMRRHSWPRLPSLRRRQVPSVASGRGRDALGEPGIPCYPKTSGSRGMHLYVAIRRKPLRFHHRRASHRQPACRPRAVDYN